MSNPSSMMLPSCYCPSCCNLRLRNDIVSSWALNSHSLTHAAMVSDANIHSLLWKSVCVPLHQTR